MYHTKSILAFCFLALSLAVHGGVPSISAKKHSWIEENKGQHRSSALYISKTPGLNIYFFKDSIVFQYYQFLYDDTNVLATNEFNHDNFSDTAKRKVALRHETKILSEVNPLITLVPSAPLNSYVNYFKGNNPSKWIRRLPQYATLRYINPDGSEYLRINCLTDSVMISNVKYSDASFGIYNCPKKASPADMVYTGFLSAFTFFRSLDVDKNHNVYGTGYTSDNNFPVTPNAFDTIYNGSDVFITKFNPKGDSLIFSSFLGGSIDESGICIKFDSSINTLYVIGSTLSNDFPVTQGVIQPIIEGALKLDFFITGFSCDGDSILYSTYFGGKNNDWPSDFIIDSQNNLVITGGGSHPFPITQGSFQQSYSGPYNNNQPNDIVVCKITPQLDSIVFSTYIGGPYIEHGIRISEASDGDYFITGFSYGGLITTANSFDTCYNADEDLYICKLSHNGDSLLKASYIGGDSTESPGSLIVTPNELIVCGYTSSNNFPVSPGAYDTSYNGEWDMFISRITLDMDSLISSTFVGGSSSNEYISDICIYKNLICFTGKGGSACPVTPNAYDKTFNGGNSDIILGFINKDLNNLKYLTYFGGSSDESTSDMKIVDDSVYFCGLARSGNFPFTFSFYNIPGSTLDWMAYYSVFALMFTPEAEFTIPNTICLGEAISPINNSFWEDSLSWTFGDGDSSTLAEPQHTYLSPGTYIITLVVTNAYGGDTLTKQITVLNKYLLNYHKEICQGDSIFLEGSWQHLTGVYTDSLNTISGCDSLIVTSLTVNPVYQLNFKDSICENDSAWLAGSWQFLAGIYTDNLKTAFGCDSVVITQLAVQPLPLFSLPADTNICEGQQLQLDAGIPDMYYLWSTGDTTQSITITPQSGVYSITVTNKWECSDTACINVVTVPLPVSSLSDSIIICHGEEITLDAGNCPNCTYIWSDGSSGPKISISQKGTYIVIIKNTLCTINDTIEVSSCAHLEMPNVFTPNGDGKNDFFLPKNAENIEQYKIEIFNRWGSLLYSSTSITEGWDGNFKSQKCSPGTYFYNARYKGPGSAYSEKEGTLQGVVTLFR